MPMLVATHSGPFHADDVMAFALVQAFVDSDATVIRTRDAARIVEADLVIDVGGIFDPETLRFDHHQATYEGPRSSAGMVLDWLQETGAVAEGLAEMLREAGVNYVDDVDNGRVAPSQTVPCFARLVEAFNQPATNFDEFDRAFVSAVGMARGWIEGVRSEQAKLVEAEVEVHEAMKRAEDAGSNVLELSRYLRWKVPYFANGGETHPTEFALFPGTDGSTRIVAIPPKLGDFSQKRSLPEEWAGLMDEVLSEVVGLPGCRFCHKNRFIAVFEDRETALQAMRLWKLLEPEASGSTSS